jgi:RNA recognition motif-containing protein
MREKIMQKIIATISTMVLSIIMLLSSIGSASAMPIVPVQSTTMATIYIGNLSYQATEENLRIIFSDYGKVMRVSMPTDRETGKKRGFAFVEMNSDQEEASAIEQLDGAEWMGRQIRVNKANYRENRRRRY